MKSKVTAEITRLRQELDDCQKALRSQSPWPESLFDISTPVNVQYQLPNGDWKVASTNISYSEALTLIDKLEAKGYRVRVTTK